MELYRAKERYTVKLRMLVDDPSAANAWPSLIDRCSGGMTSSLQNIQAHCRMNTGNSQSRKADAKALVSSQMVQRKDSHGGSDTQHVTQSGLALARKKRVLTLVSGII